MHTRPDWPLIAALKQEDHPLRVALVILALFVASRLALIVISIMSRETIGDGVDEPLLRMFCRCTRLQRRSWPWPRPPPQHDITTLKS